MARRASTRWMKPFEDFISHMRIDSKEIAAVDERGSELNLWDSQQIFLDELALGLDQGQTTFICLKARQLGVTTVSLAIDIFWMLIHPGIMGCIVTDTDGNRNIVRLTIERYLKNLPEELVGRKFKIPRVNRDFIQFPNGSRLDFLVAGTRSKATWGESRGYVFAHLTEVANYGDPNGLASFRETLSESHPDRLYIYESPLALDTPIPTPSGWTTMGEVKEGDFIIGENGKPCRVAGTSPIFINRRCFRVEFDNGDRIIADESHLWRVEERRWPTNPQWRSRDIPTCEIDPRKHFITVPEPLDLDDAALPIDPYLLGVWLGDGATAEPRITAGDDDIDEMRQMIWDRGYRLGVITKSKDRAGMFHVLGIRDQFIKLGLLGNKHIPKQYLRASERQRRLLLAGLMDTDGSVHKKNYQCNFSSTNMRLIQDVGELLSSLGIKYVEGINSAAGKMRVFPGGYVSVCQESRRLLFSEFPNRSVFRLARKRAIHESSRRVVPRKFKQIGITSVTEVPSVPVRCVAVDTPSHLFLAGRTMIPTHNTAKGFNHWKDMWDECARDQHTKRGIFIGWWAKDLNRIKRKDPRFHEYGIDPPDQVERELIEAVKTRFNQNIDVEQLAWIRWRSADQSADVSNIAQNLPWIPEQAFIFSGFSFFQTRLIARDLAEMDDVDNSSDDSEFSFKAYRYWLGTDFFATKLEQLGAGSSSEDWELRIWEEPVKNAQYVIGVDPAFGRNDWRDKHAISVWRCYADKLVQVAEYATHNVEGHQCAWVLAHLASAYRNCIVNLELSGGPGRMIMREFDSLRNRLKTEMYSNQRKDFDWEDVLNGMRWYLYHRPDSMGAGYVWNFQTTRDSKYDLMNTFRSAYTTRLLRVRSRPLLYEMQAVIQDGAAIEAPGRDKDDRVVGAALATYAWEQWVRPAMIANGQTYAAVTGQETGDETLASRTVDRLVADYFRRAAELAQDDTPTEGMAKLLYDRGLV